MPNKNKRRDPAPEGDTGSGYWECAQHGPRCCSYAGAEANSNNRNHRTPKDAKIGCCKWVPGRSLTVAEMDAREAYWTSFGSVDNIKEERR